MVVLEKGNIANPDEDCMVGHCWLRNPVLAPIPEISKEIEEITAWIKDFATRVHSGKIRGKGGTFENYLLTGIGGSALGPQFVTNALGDPRTDKLQPFFFDNTDPDGMDPVLATIGNDLNRTLCIISKSGSTKEPRTRQALAEKDRESRTITVKDVSPKTVGMLTALFERTAGFYASVVNINAFHQPAVEWGKKATDKVIGIQTKILNYISNNTNKLFTAPEIVKAFDVEYDVEIVVKVIQHLTSIVHHQVSKSSDQSLLKAKYGLS